MPTHLTKSVITGAAQVRMHANFAGTPHLSLLECSPSPGVCTAKSSPELHLTSLVAICCRFSSSRSSSVPLWLPVGAVRPVHRSKCASWSFCSTCKGMLLLVMPLEDILLKACLFWEMLGLKLWPYHRWYCTRVKQIILTRPHRGQSPLILNRANVLAASVGARWPCRRPDFLTGPARRDRSGFLRFGFEASLCKKGVSRFGAAPGETSDVPALAFCRRGSRTETQK